MFGLFGKKFSPASALSVEEIEFLKIFKSVCTTSRFGLIREDWALEDEIEKHSTMNYWNIFIQLKKRRMLKVIANRYTRYVVVTELGADFLRNDTRLAAVSFEELNSFNELMNE